MEIRSHGGEWWALWFLKVGCRHVVWLCHFCLGRTEERGLGVAFQTLGIVFCLFAFAGLGIEPRASRVLGKCPTTELNSAPRVWVWPVASSITYLCNFEQMTCSLPIKLEWLKTHKIFGKMKQVTFVEIGVSDNVWRKSFTFSSPKFLPPWVYFNRIQTKTLSLKLVPLWFSLQLVVFNFKCYQSGSPTGSVKM
jgi:hypothetical protein